MANHYELLGVAPDASTEEIRRAYVERARALHPDAVATRSPAAADAARHAMQDVNEAWRVLRDAARRGAYDRSLRPPAPAAPAFDGLDVDRPYGHDPAVSGDVTIAIVRAAPWIAALVILGVIFVFTAFARRGDGSAELVGRCILDDGGRPTAIACDQPNDGRVVSVDEEGSSCGPGLRVLVAADRVYCVDR